MRTYGRFFAEFLSEVSLVHLRLLASSTCVGLSTVVLTLALEGFLGTTFANIESTLRLPLLTTSTFNGRRICLSATSTIATVIAMGRLDQGDASLPWKIKTVQEY